jgi:hypothetical protein
LLHAGIGTGRKPPDTTLTKVQVQRYGGVLDKYGDFPQEPEDVVVPKAPADLDAIEKARGFTMVGGANIDLRFAGLSPAEAAAAGAPKGAIGLRDPRQDIDVRSEEAKAADRRWREQWGAGGWVGFADGGDPDAVKRTDWAPHRHWGSTFGARFEGAGVPPFGAPRKGRAEGVPARVSPGEYLMRGDAVRRYSSDFMGALNEGTFNPRGYAAGGPVTTALSSFAPQIATAQQQAAQAAITFSPAALAAGSANAFSLGDVGLRSYAPAIKSLPVQDATGPSLHTLDLATTGGTFQVSAASDTIEAIRASAIGSRLTSTGSRPSWY